MENHGSPEVRRLLQVWGHVRLKIENADIVIGMADKSADATLNEEALEQRKAMESYRTALYETAKAIRDQMRKELAGQAQPELERG